MLPGRLADSGRAIFFEDPLSPGLQLEFSSKVPDQQSAVIGASDVPTEARDAGAATC